MHPWKEGALVRGGLGLGGCSRQAAAGGQVRPTVTCHSHMSHIITVTYYDTGHCSIPNDTLAISFLREGHSSLAVDSHQITQKYSFAF
jgi:hypothetical protein